MRLRLRVRAGARENAVLGLHAGAFKVSVTAAPERGRANRAVIELLAETLGIPASALRIVAGETSRDKIVEIEESACPSNIESIMRDASSSPPGTGR